jgi:2'-5' RNA ligase
MMLSPATHESVLPRNQVANDQHVYLMIKPPAFEAAHMDGLRRLHGLPCRYEPARFHNTLLPLGDMRAISRSTLERILSAAASMRAEPFPVAFNRIRDNALVGSRMRSLHTFQNALVQRLRAFGLILPDYAFRPHVSLAYTERQRRNIRVEPIGWRVEEFLLVNSVHGQGHQLLGRWPLVDLQGSFGF